MARISLPFKDQFERLSAAWASLSHRERRMLGLMAAAAAVFVVALGFTSLRKNINTREAAIATKTQSMEQVVQLAEGYREAEQARQRIEARIKGTPVRLFSYLEELAKKQELSLGDMQDRGTDSVGDGISRSTVEVSFARIDLRSLTGFLNEIEKSQQLVKVEKLRVRGRSDDPNALDAAVTVSTYSLSKG
ncbi:type II secretion system protein GspM [Vulgatibacter sp.]|uniref:type II secretion system protein GspM n=1 Tax=Vulgatibacter sp. TaxID=1971226 RepID=UPI0035653E5B